MFSLWIKATFDMIEASAPWLLFGFFLAGLIHVLVPGVWIKKHLEYPGISSVIKASLVGIPLPLCSCSVIPVGIELRRRGASPGATASFLTSTPQIGIDSFILSYFLLGPFLSFARILAAFLSAISVGLLIDHSSINISRKQLPAKNCCNNCADNQEEVRTKGLATLIHQAMSYGFGKLLSDITGVLLLGFLLSGLISALVPQNFIHDLNLNPVTATILMLLTSIPVYVCATSSTPIAAALLMKGMFPGSILAFLLGGAATNMTTILAIKQEFGNRAVFYYITSIFVVSFIAALVVDYFLLTTRFGLTPNYHYHHDSSVLNLVATLILLTLLARSIALRFINRRKKQRGTK